MNRALAIRREAGASPVRSSSPSALATPVNRALFDRKLFDALHGECFPGRALEPLRSEPKVSDQLLAAMRSIPAKDRVMTCPYFHKLATTKASFYDTFFYFSHSDILNSSDRISLENAIPRSSEGEYERRENAKAAPVSELRETSAGSWTVGALFGSFSLKLESLSLKLERSSSDGAGAARHVLQVVANSALPTFSLFQQLVTRQSRLLSTYTQKYVKEDHRPQQ